MLAVRPIRQVAVAGRSAEKAAAFAEAAAKHHPGVQFTSGDDLRAAVEGAEIVCTVTASPTPIVMGDWVTPGAHVNVVGSSIPSMREVDDRMVQRGAIWVDYLPSTLAQAGEIVDMIAAGPFRAEALKGAGPCRSAPRAGARQGRGARTDRPALTLPFAPAAERAFYARDRRGSGPPGPLCRARWLRLCIGARIVAIWQRNEL